MDSDDPTALLLTKIRSLEPDYAPKIIGFLLLQDFGDRELMHLARGPESTLQTLILKVKSQLGIFTNNLSSPPSPSPLNPISRPPINGRGTSHSNGFMDFRRNSPSSSPSSTSPWSLNNGNSTHISPKHPPLLSPLDGVRTSSISKPLSSLHNNGVSATDSGADATDLLDDQQLNDYLSFLDDSCPKTEDFVDPRIPLDYSVDNGETHLHRRSFSADASFGSGEDGFGAGFKPCVYFSRGLCKNGDSCKFVHGGYPDNVDGNGIVADSPRKIENFVRQQEEMMRIKLAYQQQRLASQILGRAPQLPYEKRMDFLLHQHALSRDGAVPFDDERYWSSSPGRLERMELMAMHFGDLSNSASRQIYLTFPADSTFKDEDVATYFSLFGTVQDVRIPYQQKRMFGFVSFAHPETVKVVLARGNPHFICESRVLVKPYKEKGKVLDRKQQHLLQQIERGNYSPCSSPSGIDPREQSDFHLGSKMFYERREMMRRKMEQADLLRAIELERRRIINLQLPELKNSVMQNHHRSFSVGSPGYFSSASNQSPDFQSELAGADALEVDDTSELHPYSVINPRSINNNYSNGAKEGTNKSEMLEPDSGSTIELVLPSNLFPSATFTDDHKTNDTAETNAKVGVSSTNGDDYEPPVTTDNLMQ
ncbi:Zinc finger CCCH domain-containing protein 55 [Cardamine amara subsp. amara]|uniref:Zinc finger CCCH domain-containing protein 55 n=1 Tax=Cardamine amara subsp. amara TaxID=228776 RepID=A0ABD1ACH2_CARAN